MTGQKSILRQTAIQIIATVASTSLLWPFFATAMTTASKVFTTPQVIALAEAVQAGDTAQITSLIRAGADIRAVGAQGLTITHFALLARRDAPKIMVLVLKAGADPISVLSDGNTVPIYAVQRDDADPEVVKVLLDHGIGVNWHPPKEPFDRTSLLLEAVAGHNLPVVKLLIQRGADVNWSDGFGGTALHSALLGAQFDIAALLVDSGTDLALLNNTSPLIKNPNLKKETALQVLCRKEGGRRGASP